MGVPRLHPYRVVRVKMVEIAESLMVVGLTEKLGAGEPVTHDLSADYPPTRDVTP
jgi:hypothetical protein